MKNRVNALGHLHTYHCFIESERDLRLTAIFCECTILKNVKYNRRLFMGGTTRVVCTYFLNSKALVIEKNLRVFFGKL